MAKVCYGHMFRRFVILGREKFDPQEGLKSTETE
jgi:hypothetical protein